MRLNLGLITLSFLSFISLSHANDFGVTINQAELQHTENEWLVNAQIDFNLTKVAEQALQSSIPLAWTIKIKLIKIRPYLWNKTVLKKTTPLKIRYHSLLKLYQIYQADAEAESYHSLNQALNHLGKMTAIPLTIPLDLNEADYQMSITLSFDKEALPLPLRPEAYVKTDWSLSSKTYLWHVTK